MIEIKQEADEFDEIISDTLSSNHFDNESAVSEPIKRHLKTEEDENEDKISLQQFLSSQVKNVITADFSVFEEFYMKNITLAYEEPLINNGTVENDLDTNEDKICLQQFLASEVTIEKNEIEESVEQQATASCSDIKLPQSNLCKTSRFKCTFCEEAFTHKFKLNRHLVKHTGEKAFKCEICDKRFTRKYYLNIHSNIHTGVKQFKCKICNKIFAYKCTLKKHLKIHNGIKEFKCEICNKAFIQKYNLNVHLKTHADAKEFKCEICDKRFRAGCS